MAAIVVHARPLLAQACRARASGLRPTRARLVVPAIRAYTENGDKQEDKKELATHKKQPMGIYRPEMSISRLGSIFNDMQREMDALTKGFFDDDFLMQPFRSSLMRDMPRPSTMAMRLATDIHEEGTAFVVKADVPGMSKEDIKLKLHDGTLLISGERKEEKENKEGESAWVERSFGSFMRSFKLPPNVDAEGITAACKDGVLTVTIPKTEVKEPEAKEIPVE
jgi:HSP20 family protein